ncbi:MAG: helix-turn-helix transcriptional regulator [Spirochaetia bacterium]
MGRLQRVVGRNIKATRKGLGLTQEALAQRIGLSPSFVGELETGSKYPSAVTLERISEALSLRPYQLFLEEHDWELRDRLETVTEMHRELKKRLNSELDDVLRRHRG